MMLAPDFDIKRRRSLGGHPQLIRKIRSNAKLVTCRGISWRKCGPALWRSRPPLPLIDEDLGKSKNSAQIIQV
jgi:hypothetical protein